MDFLIAFEVSFQHKGKMLKTLLFTGGAISFNLRCTIHLKKHAPAARVQRYVTPDFVAPRRLARQQSLIC